MIVQLNPSALRETYWYEYLIRFALGGAVTVVAGVIAARFGAGCRGFVSGFSGDLSRQRHLDREACPATQREGGVIRGATRQGSGCAGCRRRCTRKLGARGFRCRYLAVDRAVSGFGSRPCDGGMAHGCGACLGSAAMALTENCERLSMGDTLLPFPLTAEASIFAWTCNGFFRPTARGRRPGWKESCRSSPPWRAVIPSKPSSAGSSRLSARTRCLYVATLLHTLGRAATGECLDLDLLELMPPLAALCPPATVVDKTRYSGFAEPKLLAHLRESGSGRSDYFGV